MVWRGKAWLCSLFDLYLAVLERSSQGFGIALLNRPGQRVLFRGIFNPAQHRGAGGQPFPAGLAARQFSFLKEIGSCVATVRSVVS
jgi:hypothetical protein